MHIDLLIAIILPVPQEFMVLNAAKMIDNLIDKGIEEEKGTEEPGERGIILRYENTMEKTAQTRDGRS